MGMFQNWQPSSGAFGRVRNLPLAPSRKPISLVSILSGLVLLLSACTSGISAGEATQAPSLENAQAQPESITVADPTTTPASNAQRVAPESQAETLRQGATSPMVLTLWHGFQDEDLLLLDALLEAYKVHTPDANFDLVYKPYDDLREHYIQAVGNGEGPQLLLGAGEWGPELFDLEAIGDVSGLLSEEILTKINPVALATVSYQDGLIGLPYEMSGIVMYRNRTLLPKAPATFRVLVTQAGILSKGGMLGAYLERGPLYAFPQIAACGGSLYNTNGYPAFNNQSGHCWIELLRSYEMAGPVSFNSNDDLDRFMAGKVGIIFDGTWNLNRLTQALGEQVQIDSWPTYNQGRLSGYVWTEDIFINPVLDEPSKWAVQSLFEFMLSSPAQNILAKNGRIPAVASLGIDHPRTAQAITALSQGTPYPTFPEIAYYWEPLQQALVNIFEGGGDITTTLQTATDQIVQPNWDYKNLEED